jgi:acetoin:2,6-dichlorophenolindophenol oxidoreductase subunit beta
MAGMRPFVDLGTASFSYLAWSQVVNEAAIARYMSNGMVSAPVVFHMLAGVRGGGAAQHSNSPQSMLCNAPGLEIVAPATPEDAYALTRAAFQSDNPTVIINHARLLATEGEVPDKPKPAKIGEAMVRRSGGDVTIVASSLMVSYSLAAAEALAKDGIAAEVVDMRTLVPLDRDTVLGSVGRTGRLVVVDECPLHCGYASEIAATVAEHGFDLLKKPIQRVTRPHIPVPFSAELEAAVTPNADKIAAAARRIMG